MDTATFFTIVTILVALILSAVGAYLILVLHEARYSLKRVNKLLDRAENLADFVEEKVAKPSANIASIFSVMNEGLKFFKDLKKTINSSDSEEKKHG